MAHGSPEALGLAAAAGPHAVSGREKNTGRGLCRQSSVGTLTRKAELPRIVIFGSLAARATVWCGVCGVLRPEDRQVAEELKRRLLAAGVPFLELRVFGSRARGDARPDSDLDVFLVLAVRTREIERQIDRIAWEVGRDAGLVIMTFECTREEMQSLPLRAAPLLEEVARDGVPL